MCLIETVFSGVITAEDLQESTAHCIALGKKMETNRFLVNAIEMELSATMMDIYNIPTKQYIDEGADRAGRLAIIAPRNARGIQAAKIFEIVCRNNGWMAKVFESDQDAIVWLRDEESPGEQHVG
jgi:hypothetical protein